MTPNTEDPQLTLLLQRIITLQRACQPDYSCQILPAYSPARWQQALQSFSDRKASSQPADDSDSHFLLPFGPEYQLHQLTSQLDTLINQKT